MTATVHQPTETRIDVTITLGGDGAVDYHVMGDLDLHTVPRFREAVVTATVHPAVVLDLTAVGFVDAAGLGAVVNLARLLDRSGGEVVVVADRDSLVRLLEHAGAGRWARVVADRSEAFAAPPAPHPIFPPSGGAGFQPARLAL